MNEVDLLRSEVEGLRDEVRAYRSWNANGDLRKELKQLKEEFRKFLEYSKIALSYEHETDYAEPEPQVKTILKFRPIND